MTTKRRTKAARNGSAGATPAEAPGPAGSPEPRGIPAADGGVLRLEGALQIRNAVDLTARLRTALDGGTLRLDAAGVTQVDTAGLQALVAAVASARRAGAAPEWLAVSPPLVDAARRLGLGALLALPTPAAG